MNSLVFCVLFLSAFFLHLSCGFGNKDLKKNVPPATDQTRSYSFTLSSCSTGEHDFSGDDESLILSDFCAALRDETLNKNCALKERTLLYEQNQCDAHLNINEILEKKGDVTTDSLSTAASSTKLNSVLEFKDIKPIPGSLNSLKVEINFLWTTNTESFLKSIPEQWVYESETVLRDFSHCGFDYSGPNCLEGQNRNLLYEGKFSQQNNHYAFFSFKYSESAKIFSILFPLNKSDQIEFKNSKAYLFGVEDEKRVHDPKFIFAQKTSIPLGVITYSKLTKDNYVQFLTSSIDSRSLMRLAFYERELSNFFNEKSSLTPKFSPSEIAKKLSQYNIDFKSLSESGDHNAIFLFFKYHHDYLSKDDYRVFILTSHEILQNNIHIHSQLAAIRDGSLDLGELGTLVKTLGQDDRDLIRIAFFSMNSLQILPPPLKIALAGLLGDDREYIRIQSANMLVKYHIDPPSITKITEVIARKSREPEIYLRALEVLSSSDLIDVNQNIIAILEHKNADLRNNLGLFLLARTPLEETLLPDLGKLMSSQHPDNRMRALILTNSLSSPDATLLLVQKVLTIEPALQEFLLKLLKARDNYSNMHVRDLLKLKPIKVADVSLTGLELMLRIKTPEAANGILDPRMGWLSSMNNKKDAELIEATLKSMYALNFSLINVPNLKLYSSINNQKFDAAIDFLISIEGDHDEVSSAVIDYLYRADDAQREKIRLFLAKRSLDGDCLLKLSSFLFRKPDPQYPYMQKNYDLAIELINGHDHVGAQIALAHIMGMPDPNLRTWAIKRLDSIALDSSIGGELAYHLTGELVYTGENPSLENLTKFEDTKMAAEKYLLQTLSPEGFTRLLRYMWIGEEDNNGKKFISEKKKDEYAKLINFYIDSLASLEEVPDIFLEEINNSIKYGDAYGRVQIYKMLPKIPRCDILENLKKGTVAKGLSQELIDGMEEAIDEIQMRSGGRCSP